MGWQGAPSRDSPPGDQTELKEPCGDLPRKCLFIHSFIYLTPGSARHGPERNVGGEVGLLRRIDTVWRGGEEGRWRWCEADELQRAGEGAIGLVPVQGSQMELKEPYGALPRKCLFVLSIHAFGLEGSGTC
jgi:hypothetical protein